MSHHRAIPLFFLVALTGGLNAAPARADDASCKPVSDAMMKEAHTPYHETAVAGGKSFEKIYTTTMLYIGHSGQWMKMPETPQDLIDATKESGITLSHCKSLRTEMVDGQAATVYAAHLTTPGTSSDAQIWIGNASGLTLKTESDTQTGPGKGHTSTHMRYGNVQAPTAGVH